MQFYPRPNISLCTPVLILPYLHTSPSAVGTLLDSARLATDPLAAVADDVLLEGELAYSPVVHVLQGDGQLVHQVLRSAWAPLPAETKSEKRIIIIF